MTFAPESAASAMRQLRETRSWVLPLLVLFMRVLRKTKEPANQVLHDGGVEAVDDVLAMALVRDEAGGLECCQVMAERGLADVEVRGKLASREVVGLQQLENASAEYGVTLRNSMRRTAKKEAGQRLEFL